VCRCTIDSFAAALKLIALPSLAFGEISGTLAAPPGPVSASDVSLTSTGEPR
jgi:hypothetical protein